MTDYTVTLNYPATSRLADIAVSGQTPVPCGEDRMQQTYTREQLCLVVCALGGCAECDALGGRTCEKVKR